MTHYRLTSTTTENREEKLQTSLSHTLSANSITLSLQNPMFLITHFPKTFSSSSTCSSSTPTSQNLSKTLSFQNLLKSGFTPNLQIFNQFLSFLSKTRRFELLLHFFSQMNSNNITPNSSTRSLVAKTLIKSNRFEEAECFVTEMVKDGCFPHKGVWDSLIQGFCSKGGDPERAWTVLQHCLKVPGNSPPSHYTFSLLIHCFSSMGNMSRAIEVLELMTSESFRYPIGNFVCSSVISGFCKIGKPELALGFYESAAKIGALCRPNVVTYTAIVNALCKEGRVNEICDLVRRMEKERVVLDAVLYSSWICGYFKEGVLQDAFRKHKLMLDKGIKPDIVGYTILVDGFSKEGNVDKAIGFLNEMKKDKLQPNLVTYTAIMRGFCQRGKVEEAFAVFRMVVKLGIEVDEITYSTLIDGLCRKGDLDQVFLLLEEMEEKGVSVGIVTYNTVINGLCKVGRTTEADGVSNSISGDNYTYSSLLHGYMKENNVVGILEIKRRMEEAGLCMDVVMCNVLIKALFMVGEFEEAYMLIKRMPQMGLLASSVTYCTMIDGFFRAGMINEALEIFDECRGSSSNPNLACYNCTIFGLCGNCMIDMAIDVFVELVEKAVPDRATYMVLIKSIFEQRSADGVLDFAQRVERVKLEILYFLYSDAIHLLCKKDSIEVGFYVYMTARKIGSGVTSNCYYSILRGLMKSGNDLLTPIMLNAYLKDHGIFGSRIRKIVFTYLCMKGVNKALHFLNKMNEEETCDAIPAATVEALAKEGRVLDAFELVTRVKGNRSNLDVVSYSIVVDGLCKEGHLSKALALCATMRTKGVAPNIVTYNSVINGLCQEGCLFEALRIFDSMEKISLAPTEFTYGSLISALCREGYLEDAKQLLRKMILNGPTPNTRVYNPLIYGHCKLGFLDEALKILQAMIEGCSQPDEFTISAVIDGYCRLGDMEGALTFYFDYKNKGMLPDFLGFLYLTRGLSIKGRMEEARNILSEMLHTNSIIELINRADSEVETEPLVSVLVSLCEQGNIEEAISIIGEVGSAIFPFMRRYSESVKFKESNRREVLNMLPHKSISSLCMSNVDTRDSEVANVDFGLEGSHNSSRKSLVKNFSASYSLIASLCSEGKIEKANRVAKEMLLHATEDTNKIVD